MEKVIEKSCNHIIEVKTKHVCAPEYIVGYLKEEVNCVEITDS